MVIQDRVQDWFKTDPHFRKEVKLELVCPDLLNPIQLTAAELVEKRVKAIYISLLIYHKASQYFDCQEILDDLGKLWKELGFNQVHLVLSNLISSKKVVIDLSLLIKA